MNDKAMMPTHIYKFCYDTDTKEFRGIVTDLVGCDVYTIDDSEDMRVLIESGEMEHIDDVVGLEAMLKQDGLLTGDDYLSFGGME